MRWVGSLFVCTLAPALVILLNTQPDFYLLDFSSMTVDAEGNLVKQPDAWKTWMYVTAVVLV